MDSVCWLLSTLGITAQTAEYRLTVIEDEAVPLATGNIIGMNRFFPLTLAVMAVVLLGVVLSTYCFRCMRYRQRIVNLCGNGEASYTGWNLRKLKEATAELELDLAGDRM
ncbi:MAG: hypothetical protein ACI4TB_09200 [Lachnospiraceae bacterium]